MKIMHHASSMVICEAVPLLTDSGEIRAHLLDSKSVFDLYFVDRLWNACARLGEIWSSSTRPLCRKM